MILDRQSGSPGETVKLRVELQGMTESTSGMAFALDYPVDALRLAGGSSHSTGDLVPGGTASLWNVAPSSNDYTNQSGTISLAASSSSNWDVTGGGGVVAELEFVIQPEATSRPVWPIILRDAEVPSSDGFEVFQLDSASINFIGQPTSYGEWLTLHFDAGEIAAGILTTPGADADLDGNDNLSEYGSGTDPRDPRSRDIATPHFIQIPGEGTFLAIEYRRSTTALDVISRVDSSTDLASWSELGVEAICQRIPEGGGLFERIVVRDAGSLGQAPGEGGFLRVRFALDTP